MERYAPSAKDLASPRRRLALDGDGDPRGPRRRPAQGPYLPPPRPYRRRRSSPSGCPGITESGKVFAGVDLTRQPLPVTPTVHYNMGGIPTNFHGEVVTLKDGDPDSVVPGLFAVGEAACVSVHGANRLGSNSLIDLVVFGRAAGLRLAETIKPGTAHAALPKDGADLALARLDQFRFAKGGSPTAEIRVEMQRTMQAHCAVFRTDELLREGVDKLAETYERMADIAGHRPQPDLEHRPDRDARARQSDRPGRASPSPARSTARKAAAPTPTRIIPSATTRNWMKHTVAWFDGWGGTGGAVRIDYRPVHEYTLTDEIEYIKPKARVY